MYETTFSIQFLVETPEKLLKAALRELIDRVDVTTSGGRALRDAKATLQEILDPELDEYLDALEILEDDKKLITYMKLETETMRKRLCLRQLKTSSTAYE